VKKLVWLDDVADKHHARLIALESAIMATSRAKSLVL
jgi:hypothetical protein